MKSRKLNNIVAIHAGIHYLVVDIGHTFINELNEVYGKHMIFQEMSDKDSYNGYNENLFIRINGMTFSACPITVRHAIANGVIVTKGDTNTYIFDSGKTLFPDQVDTILKNNLFRGIYYNSEIMSKLCDCDEDDFYAITTTASDIQHQVITDYDTLKEYIAELYNLRLMHYDDDDEELERLIKVEEFEEKVKTASDQFNESISSMDQERCIFIDEINKALVRAREKRVKENAEKERIKKIKDLERQWEQLTGNPFPAPYSTD